jgi:hypothetical protein
MLKAMQSTRTFPGKKNDVRAFPPDPMDAAIARGAIRTTAWHVTREGTRAPDEEVTMD